MPVRVPIPLPVPPLVRSREGGVRVNTFVCAAAYV